VARKGRHDALASVIDHREAAVLECHFGLEKSGVALAAVVGSHIGRRWRIGIRLWGERDEHPVSAIAARDNVSPVDRAPGAHSTPMGACRLAVAEHQYLALTGP